MHAGMCSKLCRLRLNRFRKFRFHMQDDDDDDDDDEDDDDDNGDEDEDDDAAKPFAKGNMQPTNESSFPNMQGRCKPAPHVPARSRESM
eukprot:883738-Karenia_brevis.AAC.1